jgi:hypothetical protein
MEGASGVSSRMGKGEGMLSETEGAQMSWSEGKDGRCSTPIEQCPYSMAPNQYGSYLAMNSLAWLKIAW